MNIKIPVQNNVEVIIADVFIKADVSLRPLVPPRTTEGMLVLERIETVMGEKVYTAIKETLKQIELETQNDA
jgi:hypothetical protein